MTYKEMEQERIKRMIRVLSIVRPKMSRTLIAENLRIKKQLEQRLLTIFTDLFFILFFVVFSW